MNKLLSSLRFRLAATGFLTAYAPTLILLVLAAIFSYHEESFTDEIGQYETTQVSVGLPLWVVLVTTIGFAPFAAAFAWWWSGRALRPVSQAIALQEQLMEETSHELRTPLSILTTNAEVLLAHPTPTIAIYRKGLERSETAAKRMADTIDSLLVDARGRARSINHNTTDLGQLTQSILDSTTVLANEKEVMLVYETKAASTIEARVDVLSVERAITNLITNAISHSPRQGLVMISVALSNGFAKVTVEDQGAGIPADKQAKVFERYWQSKPGKGSGIGLAIVRQVANAHGGTVTVQSPVQNGEGTRFCLQLKA